MLVLVLLTFASCEIADPIESTVTKYADFNMTGPKYLYWEQGEAFTDPGVEATEGGDPLEVQIDGTVDANTPGVYPLTYSAVNSDGFPASVTRYVAVGDKAVAASRDLSGKYDVGSRETEVSKITDGFYDVTDILPPNGVHAFMVDLGNGSIIIPVQSSPFGMVVADPSVNPDSSASLDSDTSFSLHFQLGGYGIFNRTFTQQ